LLDRQLRERHLLQGRVSHLRELRDLPVRLRPLKGQRTGQLERALQKGLQAELLGRHSGPRSDRDLKAQHF
jgi:hypothetical protein